MGVDTPSVALTDRASEREQELARRIVYRMVDDPADRRTILDALGIEDTEPYPGDS